MKNYLICLSLLMLISRSKLEAQSYHFSQFFSTPLLTNPAHTGFIEGPYRVASNLRSQGSLKDGTYFTGYLSGDFGLFRNSLPAGSTAGVGVYVMKDQTMGGVLQNHSVGISMAYNVGLDEDGIHSLGLGFQGTFHQKSIDFNRLIFENQIDQDGYNPSLPIGEGFNYYKRSYLDVNAGMTYNAFWDNGSFFGSAAVYNILKHKENILPDDFAIPKRIALQAGGQIYAGDNGKVYLSATHMRQAGASEFTIGGAYGHQLNLADQKNEINLGMWYRLKDAVIPYVGYQTDKFQFGFSFDVTVSALKTGAQIRNGQELTMIFKAPDLTEIKRLIPWY
jgi:type IX secretion system PorP/SprF family membrane protein